jgi:hypothetical protein
MSALTSNDVVILTGTVFLSYFTRVSDIHPTAFLMSEFTTANIGWFNVALYINFVFYFAEKASNVVGTPGFAQ